MECRPRVGSEYEKALRAEEQQRGVGNKREAIEKKTLPPRRVRNTLPNVPKIQLLVPGATTVDAPVPIAIPKAATPPLTPKEKRERARASLNREFTATDHVQLMGEIERRRLREEAEAEEAERRARLAEERRAYEANPSATHGPHHTDRLDVSALRRAVDEAVPSPPSAPPSSRPTEASTKSEQAQNEQAPNEQANDVASPWEKEASSERPIAREAPVSSPPAAARLEAPATTSRHRARAAIAMLAGAILVLGLGGLLGSRRGLVLPASSPKPQPSPTSVDPGIPANASRALSTTATASALAATSISPPTAAPSTRPTVRAPKPVETSVSAAAPQAAPPTTAVPKPAPHLPFTSPDD